MDFVTFCAEYFLRHPLCRKCVHAAFSEMDADHDEAVSIDEVFAFFRPFLEHEITKKDIEDVWNEAKARQLSDPNGVVRRTQFRRFLAIRFVELTFETELANKIVEIMLHVINNSNTDTSGGGKKEEEERGGPT